MSEDKIPANCYKLKVLEVEHYTDRLFRFVTERPADFRFRSGEFVMISLPKLEKLIFRAYSIASSAWDETLEFFSIKVPDGPLTEQLQKITIDDEIIMRKKSTGTLVVDALLPGKRLYLLSTGTGFAPFASLLRDVEIYEKFEQIVVIQTTREVNELNYAKQVVEALNQHPIIAEWVDKIKFYPMTTRQQSEYMGRITSHIKAGTLCSWTGLPPLNPEEDRIMICGSVNMLKELKEIVTELGFKEGANNSPASFVVEKAFVE
ncbi:ferredoxin--NADP reductase [Bartonella sp. DGB1]|uniref:ferredoxin--NADP reductase n=1 Tax=Bartonella sp. DGB1 TaxID=3239807 RepID=UPI0035264EDB